MCLNLRATARTPHRRGVIRSGFLVGVVDDHGISGLVILIRLILRTRFALRLHADDRQADQAWHLGTRGSDLSFDHLQSVARQTYVLPAADARLATGSAGRRGL